MENNSLIKIKNRQIFNFGDDESADESNEDSVELVIRGNYYKKEDRYYIFYTEALEGRSDTINNRMTILDHCLYLDKSGATKANMVYERGVSHTNDYNTPYGKMVVGTYVNRFELTESQDGLLVEMEYEMNINGKPHAECSMIIQVEILGL